MFLFEWRMKRWWENEEEGKGWERAWGGVSCSLRFSVFAPMAFRFFGGFREAFLLMTLMMIKIPFLRAAWRSDQIFGFLFLGGIESNLYCV